MWTTMDMTVTIHVDDNGHDSRYPRRRQRIWQPLSTWTTMDMTAAIHVDDNGHDNYYYPDGQH